MAKFPSVLLALLVMMLCAGPIWSQPTPFETAVRDLFGGEIVVGETPNMVASSLPLLEGVQVRATHVLEDRFTAILSSDRDPISLLFDYSRVMADRGWRPVGTPDESEFRFCGPEEALLQIKPEVETNSITARVEYRRDSPYCTVMNQLSRRGPTSEWANWLRDIPSPLRV